MSRPNRISTWSAPLLAVGLFGACGSESGADATVPTTDAPAPATLETAPPTTPATTPAENDDADCRRLTDFDPDDTNDWFVVNDGVMGGRSNGAVEISESIMRFSGGVVTAGGGFTSVRLQLDGTELTGTERVELRLRSDQRTYSLTLEDDAQLGQRAVAHQADLPDGETTDADGWSTVTVSYDELVPSVFGQPVEAPSFDPDEAREFGIIIADGTDGGFALDIDWIDVCR